MAARLRSGRDEVSRRPRILNVSGEMNTPCLEMYHRTCGLLRNALAIILREVAIHCYGVESLDMTKIGCQLEDPVPIRKSPDDNYYFGALM